MSAAVNVEPVVGESGHIAHRDVFDSDIFTVAVELHPASAVRQRDVADGEVSAVVKIDDNRSLGFTGVGPFAGGQRHIITHREQSAVAVDDACPFDADLVLFISANQREKIYLAIIGAPRTTQKHRAMIQS